VTAGEIREARYEGVPGGSFRYGMYVYNPGPYSVELIDINPTRSFGSPFRVEAIRVAPAPQVDGHPWLDSTDFVPITLGPHDERLIWITGHVADCGPPNPGKSGYPLTGKRWVETWPITFRVLGVTRHQDLPLSAHFAVVESKAGLEICKNQLSSRPEPTSLTTGWMSAADWSI